MTATDRNERGIRQRCVILLSSPDVGLQRAMIAQRTTNLNLSRRRSCSFCGVIPEIDIWRAAQLMLKRYGDQAALKESAARADELEARRSTPSPKRSAHPRRPG